MAKYKKRQEKKVTINGKRKSIYYYSDKEFQEKYAALLQEQKKISDLTYKEVAEEWEAYHEKQVKDYTYQCYIAPLKDTISWFGNKKLSEITTVDIQKRLDTMFEQDYAKQTIHLRRVVMTQVFKYAIFQHYFLENPAAAAKVPKDAKANTRDLPDEDKALKIIFQNVNQPFGLYVFLAAVTGARPGEVCALTKNDFDFTNDTININKVCILSNNSKPIIREGTKTEAGIRVLPILPDCKKILKKAVKECKSDYLINWNGLPLVKWQYRKMYEKYQKATGVKFTSYQLRHLYATLCHDANLTVRETQRLLGHKSSAMTNDIYTHIREKREIQATAKLGKTLNKIIKSELKEDDKTTK